MSRKPEVVDHYGAHYRDFAADVYGEVRREAFGEDIGQNSWLTTDELGRFRSWLELGPAAHLLDVGCGSGGPALHFARLSGCEVVGVDALLAKSRASTCAARPHRSRQNEPRRGGTRLGSSRSG